MGWNYKSLDDFDEAPDWLIEERKHQRELIAGLRRDRARHATRLFDAFQQQLVGVGPWKFAEIYAGWRVIADQELVNKRSPRGKIGGNPVRGFESRWCKMRLAEHGFQVTGSQRTVKIRERAMLNGVPARDRETGSPIYKVSEERIEDSRVVHRGSP